MKPKKQPDAQWDAMMGDSLGAGNGAETFLPEVAGGSQAPGADGELADDDLSMDMMAMLNSIGLEGGAASGDSQDSGELDPRYVAAFESAFAETKATIGEIMGTERVMADLFITPDGRATPEVTEEDFDPEDWPIYFTLRSHMRALVARNTKDTIRMAKLRWMMMPIVDSSGLTFRDACEALQCRPIVIRTRALYQLWLNDIAVDKELPSLSEKLPRVLEDEIKMRMDIGHLQHVAEVAKVCWELPGQPLEHVMSKAIEAGIPKPTKAFASLTDVGYVALTPQNRVYFISRNPSELGYKVRNNFSWAKSFAVFE